MDPSRGIDRDVVTALLEDARWAPTHGLNQPWRFHVFLSRPARSRLADGLVSIYDATTPTMKRDEEKRTKLGMAPLRAAAVIALVAKVEPNGRIPEWEEIAAVSCAAQNLMLSAHDRGIGSFWSSPPAATSPEFLEWLHLDAATHRAMGVVFLGWPLAGQPEPQSTRNPLAACTTWHEG